MAHVGIFPLILLPVLLQAFLEFVAGNPDAVADLIKKVRSGGIKKTLSELLSDVSVEELQERLAELASEQ